METRIEEFLRWLEGRGIADERLAEYRECAEHLLHEAQGGSLEDAHVEAARRALSARGVRPRTLARLDEAAAALRRYQRPPQAQPASAPFAAPPVISEVASAESPRDRARASGHLRGKKLLLPLAASAIVLTVWLGGLYAYLARPDAIEVPSAASRIELTAEEREIHGAYLDFHAALLAGDRARLRTLLVAEKLADLSGPDADQKLALVQSFQPTKVELGHAVVNGDSAVLDATGHVGDQRAKGRIELARQGGVWKVGKIDWQLTFGEEKAEKRKVARPADLPLLRGTWRGKDTGDGSEWTFTFSNDDRMSAVSARGASYAGDAVIRWDLGVEDGVIHVPPGWAPLDIELDEASSRKAIGKVALAAFSLSGGELKICGGPPGHASRVRSFERPGEPYRCLVMKKVALGELQTATTATVAQEPPSPGEATLTLDGVAERYFLDARFESRFANPKEMTLELQVRAPEHSNARRLVLVLDATHAGSHHADGQTIHDSMFIDKPVPIGRTSTGEWIASLKWIADGGQVFPPKTGTRCELRVTSAYTGSDTGEFKAEVPRCVVHSAGIDHTLADVKIVVRGRLTR